MGVFESGRKLLIVRGRVTVRRRFECGLELILAFTPITFNAQRLASLRRGMRADFFGIFFQNNDYHRIQVYVLWGHQITT